MAIIDKPTDWTSHDVVAKARGVFATRKVGHAGTLDPSATGVLVLGVGGATRLLRFLQLHPKSYVGEIVFGVETDSLDADGSVTARHDMHPTPAEVRSAARGFLGEIEQIPPMVSAVKVDGVRLHEHARAGREVERAARRQFIHRFDLEPTDDPLVYRAEVDCDSGTYIRTLAADLGTALGGGAHLRRLRRTAVGPFGIDEARPLEEAVLLPVSEAVRGFDTVRVDGGLVDRVAVGAVLEREVLGVAGDGPWAVLDTDGELRAMYQTHKGSTVKPAVVLAG